MGDLPEDVRAFLAAYIETIDPLEILLLLFDRPARAFAPDEVARELRLDRAHTERCLASLATRGLLIEERGPTYRWSSATPELAQQVEAVARAYAERRVAVITAVFSTTARMRTLAAADPDAGDDG